MMVCEACDGLMLLLLLDGYDEYSVSHEYFGGGHNICRTCGEGGRTRKGVCAHKLIGLCSLNPGVAVN